MDSETVHLIATDPPMPQDHGQEPAPPEHLDQIRAANPTARQFIEFADSAARVEPAAAASNMGSYLAFLAIRLIEMRRVLRPGGSVYVHCDDDAHLIRVLVDAIFGRENLRNEIIWCQKSFRQNPPGSHFPRHHETILFYARPGDGGAFNPQFNQDESLILSWWDDCGNRTSVTRRDRPSHPTERPLSLYKRIVSASSNEGEIVLDPFAGSGTTCIAAEELGRQWIAIENDPESSEIARDRLQSECAVSPIIITDT